jgi:hypothetical protein
VGGHVVVSGSRVVKQFDALRRLQGVK